MKRPKLSLPILMLVGILLALGLTACSSGGADAPRGRWLSLLAQIPDTERSREEVTMNDHARIRQFFDIERPAIDADEDELFEYLQELALSQPGISFAEIYGLSHGPLPLLELRTELGFTIADVDIDASAGRVPIPYQIVKGRFSEDAVVEALRTDPSFSDILEEASYDGIVYYHWGYEGFDPERITAVRPLGRGHQLTVVDDVVSWTLSVEGIEEMIDARQDAGPSLADSEDYQLLAQALDEMDTYTAFFSSDTTDLAATSWRSRVPEGASLDDLALEFALVPYVAFASGGGWDEDGQFTAVVLAHADEASAEENVTLLRMRIREAAAMYIAGRFIGEPSSLWDTLLTKVQIDRSGKVVMAKLHGDPERSTLWRTLSFESLLIHE